jgi:2OG-Fe(II) oxygenase superfamily
VNEPDDLQRILGYHGAHAEPGDLRVVGPEMVVVPFWTPEYCATIIRAAEAVGAFESSPDDPVPGHEISLAAISPALFSAVEVDLGERVWPQLQEYWPLIDYYGVRDVFVIKYHLDGQTELRLHHDVAQVSASVRLNDDYVGAELEFPRQGLDNSVARIGELLAWPSMVTHAHRSAPLTGGVKYSLTIWFELPAAMQ